MLSITPQFSMKDIENDFKNFEADIKADLIVAMTTTLHTVVDRARSLTRSEGSFNNITFNLRASIGGVIVADNRIVDTYFPPIQNGSEGHQKGIAYAQEVANLVSDGDIMLIFIAGMDYAYYVEALERDVISGSNLRIEGLLNGLLK